MCFYIRVDISVTNLHLDINRFFIFKISRDFNPDLRQNLRKIKTVQRGLTRTAKRNIERSTGGHNFKMRLRTQIRSLLSFRAIAQNAEPKPMQSYSQKTQTQHLRRGIGSLWDATQTVFTICTIRNTHWYDVHVMKRVFFIHISTIGKIIN